MISAIKCIRYSRIEARVTEGVEKGSRAGDSAGAEAIADGYPLVADRSSRGANHVRKPDAEEKAAISIIADLGFEYISDDAANLVFRRLQDGRPWPPPSSSRRAFPRVYVRSLLEQFGGRIEEHPAVVGLMVPSRGYAELICSRLEPTTARRAFRLDFCELNCLHKEPGNALLSFPYRWPDVGDDESVMRIHLSGSGEDPCVEISNASPLAMLLYGHMSESTRVRLAYPRFPFLATVKLSYPGAIGREQLGQQSEEVARSLGYELNVRNGVIVELDARPAGPDVITARWMPEVAGRIRYPRTRIQHEVAILFGFASQATDDPLLAFLWYYQALEYFFPRAIRQSAIKEIRRELRDPVFDLASDASMLRIVKAAETPVGSNESYQLRAVINEYVRAGRLEEFFQRDWGGYFTRRGPVKGIPHINVNAEQSLSDQVAERVYKIRNRIVHAKGDQRFPQVLLPRSSESSALTPDVLLVRLLATEAISVG
jgi:hypothetical protein